MQNTEFQSALASLLACENLAVVYNNKATTASFNVATRQLELPVLSGRDDELEYGLLTHEVSHALYSDTDDLDAAARKYGKQKVNIAEDLRIERLMKAKYPGVARKLPRAWTKFLPRFFEDGMQITENFWTRINAELKTDLHYTVPFTWDERAAVREISRVVNSGASLEEIIEIIDSFAREEQDEDSDQESNDDSDDSKETEESDESSDSDQDSEESGESESDESEEETANQEQESEDYIPNDSTTPDDDIKNPSFDDAPKMDPSVTIKQMTDADLKITTADDKLVVDIIDYRLDTKLPTQAKFKKFKKLYNDLAQNMLQQFYMKKQAYNYALMSEQDTGDLDSDLFSEYLTREDLFHNEQIEPNQEHHAFFTLIDFSGSMNNTIRKILGNELIVAMFCRQADIPHRSVIYASDGGEHTNYLLFDTSMIDEEFNRTVQFCYHVINKTEIGFRMFCDLSGSTPLRESIINISSYIQDWDDEGRKITILALTDGCCSSNFGSTYFTRADVPGRYFEYNLSGCFEYLKYKHSNLSVCFLFVGDLRYQNLRRDPMKLVDFMNTRPIHESRIQKGHLEQYNLKVARESAPDMNFDGFDSLFNLNTYQSLFSTVDDSTRDVSRNLWNLDRAVADTYEKIMKRQSANREAEFFVEQFLNDVA